MAAKPNRCANGACVTADVTTDGVRVTSTIDGNDGQVVFTRDEWDGFLDQVVAGKWDHTRSVA